MRQSHSVGQFIFILFFLTFSILSIITVQYIIEHDSIFFNWEGPLLRLKSAVRWVRSKVSKEFFCPLEAI